MALHKDLIIGTAKKGDKFPVVDISNLNLKFPNGGIIIGLEWIITANNQYEQTYYTKDEPKVARKRIRYSPNFGTSKFIEGEKSWIYVKGGWKSDEEMKGNNSPMADRAASIELTLSN